MNNQDELKAAAAHAAVEMVESGMVIGLGTGSTANYATRRIGELYRTGALTDIVGIPSSIRTEELARELRIPLTTFDQHPRIDVTIDGADEVDPSLNLIKGGGGALLREKVLAQATHKNLIIVDESKMSARLGQKWAIPIEVIPFAVDSEEIFLKSIGGKPLRRETDDGKPYQTDQGNYILDTDFGPIGNLDELAGYLNDRAGIVEHGLFLGLAAAVIVARESGIERMER